MADILTTVFGNPVGAAPAKGSSAPAPTAVASKPSSGFSLTTVFGNPVADKTSEPTVGGPAAPAPVQTRGGGTAPIVMPPNPFAPPPPPENSHSTADSILLHKANPADMQFKVGLNVKATPQQLSDVGIDTKTQVPTEAGNQAAIMKPILDKAQSEIAYRKKLVTGDMSPKVAGFLTTFENSTIAGKINGFGNPAQTEVKGMIADEFAQQHPALSVIAKGMGTLVDTVMLSNAGAGFNLAEKTTAAAGGVGDLYPTATRVVGKGLESGSVFGIQSFFNEGLSQAQKGKIDPAKLAAETAKGFAFGAATGGAGGTSSLFKQTVYAGAGVAGLTTIETLVQNKKLTSQDLVSIGVNSAVAMIFQAVTGVGSAEKFKSEDYQKLSYDSEVNKIMGNGVSRAEAEGTVNTLRALQYAKTYAEATGKPLPQKDFEAIIKNGIEAQINLKPTTQMQQIVDEVPESFKGLSAEEKASIIEKVSEDVKAGESTIAAVQKETAHLPGARGAGFVAPVGTPLEQMAAAPGGFNPQATAAPQQTSGSVVNQFQQPTTALPANAPKAANQFTAPATNLVDELKMNQENRAAVSNLPAQAPNTTRVFHTSLGNSLTPGKFVDTNVEQHINRGTSGETKLVADVPKASFKKYFEEVSPERTAAGIYRVKTQVPDQHIVFNSNQPAAPADLFSKKEMAASRTEGRTFGNSEMDTNYKKFVQRYSKFSSKVPEDHRQFVARVPESKNWFYSQEHGEAEVFDKFADQYKSLQLNAEVIPGLHKFIEEDVKPKAAGTTAGIKEVFDKIVQRLNPGSLVPMKAMDILTTNIGNYEKQLFRTERSMKKIWKMWESQPLAAKMDFMAKMEAGDFASIPEAFRPLAEMYKARYDNMYHAINEYKEVLYLQNWFPHLWKKETQVVSWLGKRPLAGSQNFLHQRIFATIQDGLNADFKLLSENPEQLTQMAEASVARFIMANRIRVEEKKAGFFKYVKFNKPVPDGFAKIEDRIAEIYLPKDPDAIGSASKIGNYYAHEDLARVINNYLSKDLLRETALGRGILNVKNSMNAFQLGLSAFHATAEAINSMVTAQDIALSKFARGNVLGGAKDLILSPIAAAFYFNDGRKFYNGSPELMKIEHDIFTGGAKLRTNRDYTGTALDNFIRNVKTGNLPGAAMRLIPAVLEASLKPLFTYLIPRVKVGAFRALFEEELIRNEKKIVSGEVSREKIARDVWANIENRFGLINYDRLFWNNTFKTAMFMTTRAVGWNYGTAAELGGAVADVFGGTGKTVGNVINLRKNAQGVYEAKNEFDFTPKIRYALSLIFSTMVLGGMYMFLHTGKKPQTLVDWFYPLDEKGRRKQFPSYMKDIYGILHDPKQTVINKMAPELTTMIELFQNRNYYGDMIYNPDDNIPIKLKQMRDFVLSNSFTPFSITQQQQLSAKGGITKGERVESFLGITNAPAVLNKTQAELDLQKKERQIYGNFAPRTPEQVQIDTLKTQAKAEIKKGDMTTFDKLKKMGAFKSPKEAALFLLDAKQTPEKKAAGITKSVDRILKYQGK